MIVLTLLLSALASDASIDKGFRGLAWGEQLDSTVLRGECKPVKMGVGCLDEIGSVPVYIVYSSSTAAGLYSVIIMSRTGAAAGLQCGKLLDTLESAYGPGVIDPITRDRQWRGQALRGYWEYNEFVPSCTFIVSHDEASAKHRAAEKARAAEAAQGDL
jgi:hypothetical protein